MSLEHDVAAARRAVDDLEQACARVLGHFADTVDSRRLRVDVTRLRTDLDLVCGAQPVGARAPQYPSVVWDDGYDGSIGGSGRTAP
jgi:hypothetical protein